MLSVGIPRELKTLEGRVSLTPAAVGELSRPGALVFVERGVGLASGFTDADYAAAGGYLCDDAESLYREAQLIIKVKEPIAADLAHLRREHTLFCYLHLAANADLLSALLGIGLRAFAFEVVGSGGRLPLLAPMSEIAGRLAVQSGARYLQSIQGGRGVLLGVTAGTERGRVTVLGAGNAGRQAIAEAAAMGANVSVFDVKADALQAARTLGANVTALYPSQGELARVLADTDLLVGAVLIPGSAAPRLISRDLVRQMPEGSVIVDIAIDQGGCIMTIRPTDYRQPSYIDEGVIHIGVTNLPSAVPRTASIALSVALLPYAQALVRGKGDSWPALRAGLSLADGVLQSPALVPEPAT